MPTVTTKSGRCQGNPRRMTSVKPAYQREANIYPACLNPWHGATAAPQSAYRPDRLTCPPTLLPGYTLYDVRKSLLDFRPSHHREEHVGKVQHIPELSRPETKVSLRDTDFKVHFGRTDLKNANRSLITNRAVGISGEATK